MQSGEIRRRFLDFFEKKGHKIVPSSSLVPTDSSVLLTTAGMQQFKPYFLGESSPWGQNVASIQKCFRTSDIDEVGDERHLTFFEMLGNFSFGGYFKKEAIGYAHEFVTKEMGLTIDYVTILTGDKESEKIWRDLGQTDIREMGAADNFWGPTGTEGPCGPTTEIYVDGIEVWNIVFNEFYHKRDGRREKLQTPGIDTGMGLERLAKVVQNAPTVFETDLFAPLMASLPTDMEMRKKRILADHSRAVVNLIADGVRPSNKGAGYVLRRLIRRMIVYGPGLDLVKDDVFAAERAQFEKTLAHGMRELEKLTDVNAQSAFQLFETYGLPFEVIKDKFPNLSHGEFDKEFEKHQQVSRAGLAGKFAGGLADHEPATIKLHTAHHLLLAALQQVLGKQVKQRGSNITQERLRLDFSYPEKLTEEQKKEVERIVNEKIKENLPVVRKEMPKAEAEQLGAEMEFGQKYGDTVSVYLVGEFSKEFCGGPHVSSTGELGVFKILKEEAVSAGVRRIKATLDK